MLSLFFLSHSSSWICVWWEHYWLKGSIWGGKKKEFLGDVYIFKWVLFSPSVCSGLVCIYYQAQLVVQAGLEPR